MSVLVFGNGARRPRPEESSTDDPPAKLSRRPASWVLVFLAHDGVHQARAWNTWRETSSNKDDVAFSVRAPDVVAHGSQFCRVNAPSSRARPMGATSWCSSSVAYEIVEAFRDARKDHPEAIKFTLVSGTCCPVRPLKSAYARIMSDPSKDMIPGMPRAQTWQTWVTYTSSTLDALIEYTDANFGHWVATWLTKPTGKCSEENYFVNALDELEKKGLYSYERSFMYAFTAWDPRGSFWSSPDEWTDFTTLHQLRTQGNPKSLTCSNEVSLVNFLLSMRMVEYGFSSDNARYGMMFVRKVMSSADVGAHPVLSRLLYDENLDKKTLYDEARSIFGGRTAVYDFVTHIPCKREVLMTDKLSKFFEKKQFASERALLSPEQLKKISSNYDLDAIVNWLKQEDV